MVIKIKPQTFKGDTSWESKRYGVVLVEKESDIEPLWKLLCEQDDYWESYKYLIRVAPEEIDSIRDINRLCQWCGKTDIYDVKKLQLEIPFIIHQYSEES